MTPLFCLQQCLLSLSEGPMSPLVWHSNFISLRHSKFRWHQSCIDMKFLKLSALGHNKGSSFRFLQEHAIVTTTLWVKCFMYTVPDRTAATLLSIIRVNFQPGTTAMSDQWRAYTNVGQISGINIVGFWRRHIFCNISDYLSPTVHNFTFFNNILISLSAWWTIFPRNMPLYLILELNPKRIWWINRVVPKKDFRKFWI